MSKFNFRARDGGGRLVEGELDGESEQQVSENLRSQGLTPVKIVIQNSTDLGLGLKEWLAGFKRVKSREISVIFRQLATIFSAGVPLYEALLAIEEQVSNPYLKQVINALHKDVEAGLTFSQAMTKHPKAFSGLVVTMVRSGEQGGVLADVLAKVSKYLETEDQLQQKIHGALRYPVMVLISLLGAFMMAVTFIIPKFKGIFSAQKAVLPLPTRVLLFINYLMVHYWWAMLGAALLSYWGFKSYLATPAGRRQWDRLLLVVPVFGLLNSKLALSRFFRMLAAMISSGIPLVQALSVTANTAGNVIVSETIQSIRDKIVGGGSLSGSMKQYPLFPSTSVHMAAIGEKSGNLEQMLLKSADYFDEETDYTVSNLMVLLEPFLILFLALLVLLLALGIFLPMWSMMQLYK